MYGSRSKDRRIASDLKEVSFNAYKSEITLNTSRERLTLKFNQVHAFCLACKVSLVPIYFISSEDMVIDSVNFVHMLSAGISDLEKLVERVGGLGHSKSGKSKEFHLGQ